jgi:hypothetical protein
MDVFLLNLLCEILVNVLTDVSRFWDIKGSYRGWLLHIAIHFILDVHVLLDPLISG